MSLASAPLNPLYFARPMTISPSPAYLMSGALTTFSLLNFLRHPSLRSTGLLVAGTSGAALYYAGGKAAMTGLEDGPWVGVGVSSLVVASTLPRALRTTRAPAPIMLGLAALGVGAYYFVEATDE